MKTLDQVQPRIPISSIPFDITKAGSYYLTQNVSGGAPGIVVKVSGVTLDLNGFTITGPGKGLPGTGSGIAGLDDTVVRNGRVADFGDDGVKLGAACVVENLDVVNIGGSCITVGEQSRVERCRVGAGGQGIVVGLASIINSCTSIGNTAASLGAGIVAGPFGTISNSLSSYNAGDGISAGSSVGLTHCVAANNAGSGIVASTGAQVKDCVAENNTVSGIVASTGSMVIESTSRSNKGIGINVGAQCTVQHCNVTDCAGVDGIRATNACVLLGNHIVGNLSVMSGAGLHVTAGTGQSGSNSRIEANEVMQVYRGIQVDTGNNLIIKNSVGGSISSKYQIAIGNAVGVFVTASSGAIDGSGGGSGVGTTDPWANLSY